MRVLAAAVVTLIATDCEGMSESECRGYWGSPSLAEVDSGSASLSEVDSESPACTVPPSFTGTADVVGDLSHFVQARGLGVCVGGAGVLSVTMIDHDEEPIEGDGLVGFAGDLASAVCGNLSSCAAFDVGITGSEVSRPRFFPTTGDALREELSSLGCNIGSATITGCNFLDAIQYYSEWVWSFTETGTCTRYGDCPITHVDSDQDSSQCFLKCTEHADAGQIGSAAGDPHIRRVDGVTFDIDTSGTYKLFQIPANSGSLVSVTTEVAPSKLGSREQFNQKCEITGSMLGGHNVTATGGKFHNKSGLFIDSEFTSITELLQSVSQYTRQFSDKAMMIVEMCQFGSTLTPYKGHRSTYCSSVPAHRQKNTGAHSSIAYMTMVTDVANVTVRWSGVTHSHVDVYLRLAKDVDSSQYGGLLLPKAQHGAFTRRTAYTIGRVDDA